VYPVLTKMDFSLEMAYFGAFRAAFLSMFSPEKC